MLQMILLFFFAVLLMFILLIPDPRFPHRRFRTQREDDLHDQVQQAMNWTSDTPYLCEDGKWRDSKGNTYVSTSLEEALEAHDRFFPECKRISPEDENFLVKVNKK
jgi:hypothetical protein